MSRSIDNVTPSIFVGGAARDIYYGTGDRRRPTWDDVKDSRVSRIAYRVFENY